MKETLGKEFGRDQNDNGGNGGLSGQSGHGGRGGLPLRSSEKPMAEQSARFQTKNHERQVVAHQHRRNEAFRASH